jgi:hypothetical protein
VTTTTGLPDVPGHYWRIRSENDGASLDLELVRGRPRPLWLAWTQRIVARDHLRAGGFNMFGVPSSADILETANNLRNSYDRRSRKSALVGTYPPKTLGKP